MKIGVDLTFIKANHLNGGTESVIKNIMTGITRLAEDKELKDEIVFFIHKSIYPEYKRRFPSLAFKPYNMPGSHPVRMILFQTLYLPKLAAKEGIDVMYFPTFQTGLGKFDMPVVVSPNDIQYKYCPKNFSRGKRIYYQIFYRKALKRAERLILISDYTRICYEKHFKNAVRDKMRVCHVPIDFKRFEDDDRTFAGGRVKRIGQERYILCINSLIWHKNLITLIKAYNRLVEAAAEKGEEPEYKLVLAGGGHKGVNELEQYIDDNDLGDHVIFTGTIEDKEVAWLYKNAELFVTPSLYEGFGMTPVEAMAAECPVISSRETSLPEATLGMVRYYENATDDEELYRVMTEELAKEKKDRKVKKELKERHEAVKNAYEIKKVTRDYLSVIHEAYRKKDENEENGEADLYRNMYRYVEGVMEDHGRKLPVGEDDFVKYSLSTPDEINGSVMQKMIAASGIRDMMGLKKLARKLPPGVQAGLRKVFS